MWHVRKLSKSNLAELCDQRTAGGWGYWRHWAGLGGLGGAGGVGRALHGLICQYGGVYFPPLYPGSSLVYVGVSGTIHIDHPLFLLHGWVSTGV